MLSLLSFCSRIGSLASVVVVVEPSSTLYSLCLSYLLASLLLVKDLCVERQRSVAAKDPLSLEVGTSHSAGASAANHCDPEQKHANAAWRKRMERPSTDLQGTPEFIEWWQLATRCHGLEGEYELHDA